jgi:peroxiredoxin
MRVIALALVAALVPSIPADEPKRNPFRDGTGKASSAPAYAKEDPIRNGPKILRAADAGVGRLVADAAFTDMAGKPGKLSDFRECKLLVVAFTDTGCPICRKYAPTLAKLEKEYAAKGVAFLFVNPIASDEPGAIRKAIAAHGFTGRYVHDRDGKLTAALGARSTTEVFVLDSARTIVYRGAVDDQYGIGYSLDAPRSQYLATALDESLAGKQPVIAATTAPGCELDPGNRPPIDLTYHARIERIMQANCVECHRAGGVGPFALQTYDQVIARKAAIRRVIDDRTMPPWFAAPPEKGSHSPWINDRSLAADDRADLLAWLGGDLKKGNPADAPLPRTFASGWLIGKPDAIFELPEPVEIKATGVMPYKNVLVEGGFDEDRWLQALEVQPGDRQVVHHVLVFAVASNGGRRRAADGQAFLAAYVPGNSTLVYPEGYAKKLPKGSDLLFQLHYTPNGTATTDRTKLGVIFAKSPPRHVVEVTGIFNRNFAIPAGEANHKIEARMRYVPFDTKILAFFPHAHLRGKAARYDVKFPDGTTQNLLTVPHYDFNWQLNYRYAEPIRVPRGSELTYTAWYDNSSDNPANPDPAKIVKWGPQTFDEMHLGYLEYVRE